MRAKNYDNVLKILILKYSSGPEKSLGLSRNGPLVRDIRVCLQRDFCVIYNYVEKADLSKSYQTPKRKLG